MVFRNIDTAHRASHDVLANAVTDSPNHRIATALLSAVTLAALLIAMNGFGEATGAALYLGGVVL